MVDHPYTTGLVGALGALTAVTAANLVGQLSLVLWSLAVAVFLAIGLTPLVRAFQRWGLPRPAAVAAVAVSMLLATAMVLLMIMPPLLQQATQLLDRADEVAGSGALEPVARYIQQLVPIEVLDVGAVMDRVLVGMTSGLTLQGVSDGLLSAGATVGNAVFATSIIFVLTVYLLASQQWFRDQLLAALPAGHRGSGTRVLGRVADSVGRYFTGQLALAVLNGGLSLVVLLLTGSALPLLFAAVALVGALIPLVGIALSAAVIVAAQFLIAPDNPFIWVVLAVYYLVYLQVEAYVIAPRVVGRAVAMPDVMVLLVTLVGGTLYGIVGALLSVPAAVIVHLTAQEVARARRASREADAGSRQDAVPLEPAQQ